MDITKGTNLIHFLEGRLLCRPKIFGTGQRSPLHSLFLRALSFVIPLFPPIRVSSVSLVATPGSSDQECDLLLYRVMRTHLWTILAIATAAILYANPAEAQATRTWVSGVGDDANPCSRTAPCKTFAGAISKTAPGGEINVLDPGGFGAVTITKSISIISVGFEAGVLVSGTNAINVVVGDTDKVLLEGLDIEGLGTGLQGINITGGGKTTIRRCSIRNFTQNGINLVGTANARAVIENTTILNNTGAFNMQGNGGAVNTAFIQNCTLDNNSSFATQVASPSTLVLIGSTLTGSPSAITGGGSIISYGNNVIRNAGNPTSTVPLR
jgi:Right handed beta helix region